MEGLRRQASSSIDEAPRLAGAVCAGERPRGGARVIALDDEVMRLPTRPASSPKGGFPARRSAQHHAGQGFWRNMGRRVAKLIMQCMGGEEGF